MSEYIKRQKIDLYNLELQEIKEKLKQPLLTYDEISPLDIALRLIDEIIKLKEKIK